MAGVDEKGPAKTAGLEVGDVIVKFNGTPVKASSDLPRIVASTPVGQKVDVVVVRKGEEATKPVTLGRLEDSDKPQLANLRQPEPESATRQALGLNLSGITDELRKQVLSIKDGVKGVVVTRVDPNSTAADKRIQPGEVIVEVGQEAVNTPADVTKRVDSPEEGRPQVGPAAGGERHGRRALRGDRAGLSAVRRAIEGRRFAGSGGLSCVQGTPPGRGATGRHTGAAGRCGSDDPRSVTAVAFDTPKFARAR